MTYRPRPNSAAALAIAHLRSTKRALTAVQLVDGARLFVSPHNVNEILRAAIEAGVVERFKPEGGGAYRYRIAAAAPEKPKAPRMRYGIGWPMGYEKPGVSPYDNLKVVRPA